MIQQKITLNQLFILMQFYTGLNQRQIAEKAGISKSQLTYNIKTGFKTLGAIKRIFKGLEIPFSVKYKDFILEEFQALTFSKLAYLSTGINKKEAAGKLGFKYGTFKQVLKSENIKIKDLKKYFDLTGQKFNIVFNNEIYIIK